MNTSMPTLWILLSGLLLTASGCLPAPVAPTDAGVECGAPCAPDTLRCSPGGEGQVERCVFNIASTGCYGWVVAQDCPRTQRHMRRRGSGHARVRPRPVPRVIVHPRDLDV